MGAGWRGQLENIQKHKMGSVYCIYSVSCCMSLVCRKAFFVLCRNGTGSGDVSYRVKKRLGYLTGIEGERGDLREK